MSLRGDLLAADTDAEKANVLDAAAVVVDAALAVLTGLSSGELAVLDAVTAGAVAASKAVVVDANKDIGDFRNLDAVNLDAGSSGVAGSVDVFPVTASRGKLAITITNQTGDTTVGVNFAAMAAARTLTVPDPGASASFAMTEGVETLNGVKTFGSGIAFGAGATLDVDSAAVAATGNDTTQTATITKMAGTVTTGALTTVASGTTAVVLTLTGVVAGDLVLITMAGGTNTTPVAVRSSLCTTNTITVIVRNDVLITTALNGTVAFHYIWMKA